MMLSREIVTDAAVGVGIADTPEGLSAIHHPGCAAVVWRRQAPSGFQRWIDTLAPDRLPDTRVVLRPTDVFDEVAGLCEEFEMPEGPERAWLIRDAADLAARFSALVPAPYLRLRLDVVTGNACKKFHIDAITARLICTYRGTGTQYGISTDGEAPRRIFTVPTGAPVILRGTRWPETPRSGLLHRSPPIAGTGETRLVLVLDPMTEPVETP